MENLKEVVIDKIDEVHKKLCDLSDYIWENPEYNYEEYKSSQAVKDLLESYGFTIEAPVGGIETAFKASIDSGKPGPHLGFLAEYDAVPGKGHACGHNIMAGIASGAGIAFVDIIKDLRGRITVYGCPAEEGGGGKVVMLEKGVFNDLDVAMILHTANETVVKDLSYSKTDVVVDFYGKEAHAATWPDQGISALSPLLMVFDYIDRQRLHWNKRGTILGVISKGGDVPIMIPDHCQGRFTIRSFDNDFKLEIMKDFEEACNHIASLTKTRVEFKEEGFTYLDIRNNPVIEDTLEKNLRELGEDVRERDEVLGIGCTDVGNITHVLPAHQSYIKLVSGLVTHSKELEAACYSPAAHKTISQGAKALAMTALEFLQNDELLKEVKLAFEKRQGKI